MMHSYLRVLFMILCCVYSALTMATSSFHSYITDLSPPYICKLNLKSARGVSLSTKHNYLFSGICSIKLPIGNNWVYQNAWVDIEANWDDETHEGREITTLSNGLGTVVAQLKCDADPWLTKSQCALIGYQNNTQFTNLGGVFNARNGQYPPFETITGQYPPLARNQVLLKEAIALSIRTARQESAAAHTAFTQTFGAAPQAPVIKTAEPQRTAKIFKKPKIDNLRVDCCLRMNAECGKPAADRYCRSQGFKQSVNCKIDQGHCSPTFILGTQTVCTDSRCKGFEEVECSN